MTWCTRHMRSLWLAVCCNPNNCLTRWQSPKLDLSLSRIVLLVALFRGHAVLWASEGDYLRGKLDFPLRYCRNLDCSWALECSFLRGRPNIFQVAASARIPAPGSPVRPSSVSVRDALHSEHSVYLSGILGTTPKGFLHHADLKQRIQYKKLTLRKKNFFITDHLSAITL